MRNKTSVDGNIKKNRILNAVRAIPSKQSKRKTDWANELNDELRADLEKSLNEAGKGKMISHEDAMKQIKIRFNL